jgi:hypothetical protein
MKETEMKNETPHMKLIALFAAFAATGLCAAIADEAAAPGENAAAATNATEVAQIPKSIFTIPAKPEEGKNPFFPELTDHLPYSASVDAPVKTTEKRPSAALVLQGFSGTPEKRLAIISNVVFGTNDVRNVGSLVVRCLEINETSVVIEVGGERRELRFQSRN